MAPARAAATILAALAGPLAAASAQAETRYPASLDKAALAAWLAAETDITPSQVLAVSPAAVTALVSTLPIPNGGSHASIRGEAIRPEGGPKPGVVSWQTSVEADCRGKRIKVGATSGYADRNLLGQPMAVSSGDSDWRAPPAGTQLENVWRALCEPGFVRPLTGAGAVAVSRLESAAQPEPAPAPAPARPGAAPVPARPAPVADVAVQVVASASEAEAVALATRVRDRFDLPGRSLRARTGEVQVQGRTLYRGLVSGFSSREEAVAWCDRLKAAGQACLIR